MIKLISFNGKGKDFVRSSSEVVFVVTITEILHKYYYKSEELTIKGELKTKQNKLINVL